MQTNRGEFVISDSLGNAMIRRICTLLSLGISFALAPVAAHHSGARGEPVRIEGVVQTVRMINPHAQIIVEVKAETGDNELWVVTSAPPTELRYLGWTSTTVPVGAKIKVLGRPAGLGERTVDLDTIEFEDGRLLVASLPLSLQPGLLTQDGR